MRYVKIYRARPDLVPELLTSLHFGPVVTTEVGDLKSEVVFRQKVMKTASRVQNLRRTPSSPFTSLALWSLWAPPSGQGLSGPDRGLCL